MPPKVVKDQPLVEGSLSLSAEDLAAYYKSSATSLQLQLADRTALVSKANEEKKSLEERVRKISADFEEEQKAAFEIARDMTRQYKGMQEQLLDRVTELSQTVRELQDRLEEAEHHHDNTLREKNRVIHVKDDEINEMKAKMEDMAHEFGGMLKQTLEKMRQRIEVTSNTLDVPAATNAIEKTGSNVSTDSSSGAKSKLTSHLQI
mmetsp:Transcript_28434/g.87104  ORF Transcript_28434/g.87104 Transcript_28434/m.87104 type:complete len:205 (-) Transcript_28434:1083-1697(-)|eukprot:CAMPEP_0198659312 /NCGR_PEP_ID=MMETSP1467-20131203/31048_1 /TAXON_ID=1462469 /ORGANISM="unid. sp., Strain CCMP2135" /LENGTH=204 /DNA_ID=CAMNT_0044395647 /DNA_START=150 /DNA_END=764 /DNA_ORIENTATION=+